MRGIFVGNISNLRIGYSIKEKALKEAATSAMNDFSRNKIEVNRKAMQNASQAYSDFLLDKVQQRFSLGSEILY